MKAFGHKRPVRDKSGNIIDQRPSPVRVRTIDPLGGSFGPDKERRLILTMGEKDMVYMRPERTSVKRTVGIRAVDLYRHILMCVANSAQLEKARATKARKQAARERRNLDAAERRLRKSAKEGR